MTPAWRYYFYPLRQARYYNTSHNSSMVDHYRKEKFNSPEGTIIQCVNFGSTR